MHSNAELCWRQCMELSWEPRLLCWLRLFMRRFYSVQTETNLHENAHNANVCNKNTPGTQRQRNKLQKPQKPNSENLTSRVLLLLLLLAYLQTTASYLDKLVYVCVAVRRGDGHGRVQLPLGGHDVQAAAQLLRLHHLRPYLYDGLRVLDVILAGPQGISISH